MNDNGTPTAGDIWRTLSSVDVSAHVERKGNLSYLSWAWAWAELMKYYPDATVAWDPTHYEPDGSATVSCTVTIGAVSRYMWLPVMDNRNRSVAKPSSRDISDARMRCMVKCLALYGLGHYLYAGEDIPASEGNKPAHDSPRISASQVADLEAMIEEVGADYARFLTHLKIDDLGDLPASSFGRAVQALEAKRAQLKAQAAA